MRVKTCTTCPYSPKDLGEHYDPNATEFCCGRCPQQGLLCMERGPYFRDPVVHFDRTNYAKRQGGSHGVEMPRSEL